VGMITQTNLVIMPLPKKNQVTAVVMISTSMEKAKVIMIKVVKLM